MLRSTIAFASVIALAPVPAVVSAQAAYPAKPVNMVVPYAAGGATDVIARLVADGLSRQWPKPVIVMNRPGAGTVLGAESVARAAGDGYTLYMTTAAHTISGSLYPKLSYDPVTDFAAITRVASIPLVLVVNPSVRATTASELVALVKSKPEMGYASPGNGSPQHLTMELFKAQHKLDLVHVPYKGDAPMMTDLIGGQVQMAFVTLSSALPYIKTGKVKALAIASAKRMDAIAEVPTFGEAGLGSFQAATWFGLLAPAALPQDLQDRIYKDVSAVVSAPAARAQLAEMGAEIDSSSPQAFRQTIAAESKRWAEAVRVSGAKPD
jgi:tripartite-type tricarboxylate transporter receptor subunit TctC